MSKPVDMSNKKNIYCGHCEHYTDGSDCRCKIDNSFKFYWNRCKKFEWKKKYMDGEKK